MAGIIVFGHHVIDIWVGEKYRIPNTLLILMSVYFYLNISRAAVDAYINAYRLLHDVWASLAEGGVFLLFAFVLGHYWGLEGILTASIMSQVFLVHLWKPIFLFREGLHRPVSEYWLSFLKFPIISALFAVIASYVYTSFALEHYSISEIVLHGGIFAIVFSLALGGVYYAVSQGFRKAVFRILALVFKRFR